MKNKTTLLPIMFGSLMMLSSVSPAFCNLTISSGIPSNYVPIDLTAAPLGVGSPYSFDSGTIYFDAGYGQGIVQGDSTGQHATPDTVAGPEYTGKYFAAGPASISIVFDSPEKTFALLWGSYSYDNGLSFYKGSDYLGAILWTDVAEIGGNGFTVTSDVAFDTVVFNNDGFAFEAVPFEATATPEPGFYGLMGLGFSGLSFVSVRRRRASSAKR